MHKSVLVEFCRENRDVQVADLGRETLLAHRCSLDEALGKPSVSRRGHLHQGPLPRSAHRVCT